MNNITVPNLMFTSKPSGDRLLVSAYKGSLTFVIFSKDSGSKPIFSDGFTTGDIYKIKKAFEELRGIGNGNQKALTLTKFIDGSYKPAATLCFGTDDNGVKYIELQFKEMNSPKIARFSLYAPSKLRATDKEYNSEDASKEALESIIWWMDNILPAAILLTNEPYTQNKNKNNQSSGKSF